MVEHTEHRRVLGELECAVMEAIWHDGEATVRDVLDAMTRVRDIAYTTVMTVMTRLVEKGLLRRNAGPTGSFVYQPRVSREAFYARASRQRFAALLREAGPVAVAQFVDALEEVDPDLIAALRARLRRTKE